MLLLYAESLDSKAKENNARDAPNTMALAEMGLRGRWPNLEVLVCCHFCFLFCSNCGAKIQAGKFSKPVFEARRRCVPEDTT